MINIFISIMVFTMLVYLTALYSIFGFVILDQMTAERFFYFLFDFSSILMFIIGYCMFRMIKKVPIGIK